MILHPDDDDSTWIESSRTFGICVLHWSLRLESEKALQLAFMVVGFEYWLELVSSND